MRKAQKQEMLEMIQTLHQAHDEIKGYIEGKKYALAQDMIAQCQECAISIGTAIERLEGEGFITVSYVEAYCDLLFSVHEELNGSGANANKIHKNIKKQLLRIENSVKNDIPVRKEIAFFPYKASMWDSLESVYLAAKEDANCDVYCVPIPYYDRKPDRSLGELHYEGREYPKNIEVIDWQTYNFEERKPDTIYIHNPYDDYNLVTCVHPRFFASNLKKYTEELVYIPYFVLNEIEPSDQLAIDGMKHFCFLPGVFYADKVIVQSEKMKEIYINEYIKAAKEGGISGRHTDRKHLEEKILGLGSPKFDKVQNTKKEELDIPAEWLNIIEKSDGSWKKIIFYNTSITALLEHNEKMLEKMKYVFRIFEENKNEVALLWRPHPLIKTTVESMRPELWTEYDKLVQQYRLEGWGIYDDSSDMDRAVVLSDAYYGDQSSVLQVYKKTNKNILIQNIWERSGNNGQMFLCSYTGCFREGKLFLISEVTNAVITVSIGEKKLENVCTLEKEEYVSELSLSFFIHGKKMVVVPYNAHEFYMIDMETGKQNCIMGVLSEEEKYISRKFHFAVVCENRAWIIGENLKRILVMNLETMDNIRSIPFDEIEGLEKIGNTVLWSNNYVVKENQIMIPSRNYGVVLCIDNASRTVRSYSLPSDILGYSCIYEWDNHIYMLDNSGNEYTLDTHKYEIEKTGNKLADACWQCITAEKKKYYFGAFTGKIFVYESGKMEELEYKPSQNQEQRGLKFQFVKKNENTIYFQERFSGYIYVIDIETNMCCRKEIEVSDHVEIWRKRTIEENKNAGGYEENTFLSLDKLFS